MIEVSPALGISLNIAAWLCWSLAVGYFGHRRPLRSFTDERWWSRLRPFESGGSWYARTLRIKQWKDLLPELGALFSGGFAKRVVHRDRDHLERFVIETRRAEWVHWLAFWLWPVFAIWNPPWAVAVMLLYATAANLPCLVVQRYNRARLLQTLTRFERGARSGEHEPRVVDLNQRLHITNGTVANRQ
jgi:glycosyl-4,4'-diaponeurosporenoate acyltransferase